MRQFCLVLAAAIATFAPIGLAQQGGPYKVLKTARVGGEGGWDYIYADAAGRRLYIPRRGTPATPAVPTRLTIFNLDTLEPVGEIAGIGGNGAAVDPKSGHGFTSSKPVSMFDTKTMTLIKTIDVGAAQPDGIYFDRLQPKGLRLQSPDEGRDGDRRQGRHRARHDRSGRRAGAGRGRRQRHALRRHAGRAGQRHGRRRQDDEGDRALSVRRQGRVQRAGLDAKNHVLFAACANSGNPPAQPAQPMMVILSAKDGKILTSLPLAGGSDGAVFNPATMEAFSTHGNGTLTVVKEKSPTSFEVEQNLETMNGARTITFDSKTNHIFTMSQERGPAPPPPPGGGRGAQGTPVPGSFTILMIGK